jgi:hypothetical protein
MNLGRQARAWYFTYVLGSAGATSASFGAMTDVPSGAVRTFIGIEEVGSLDAGSVFHLLDSQCGGFGRRPDDLGTIDAVAGS